MNIYNLIEVIKLTEQRGQELLIDALIIGIEIGRNNLKNIQQVESIVESLKKLKCKIDLSILSPFLRNEIFDNVLNQNEKLEESLQNVQLEFQRQSKLKQQSNICQICNEHVDDLNNQKFNASCKHQFHRICIIHFLNQGLNGEDYFKCPLCGQQTLQQQIEKEIKEQTAFKKSCCPNAFCKTKFLFVGQEIYRCNQCKNRYCLKCQLVNHPINQCKKDRKHTQFEMGDNYKECPKCRSCWVKQQDQQKIMKCVCGHSFCIDCGVKDEYCNCNRVGGGIYQTYRWFKKVLSGQ
ncbi:unnamed protein product [Paramecium sonneborni]|uniref:RING-type domain-containing protein n=1 Tax=Paramecium sonneborni TaxID=65129 RepID=A0A8S1R511_9CILI|nr:unnamed protein product [Paramecium sonneborni]